MPCASDSSLALGRAVDAQSDGRRGHRWRRCRLAGIIVKQLHFRATRLSATPYRRWSQLTPKPNGGCQCMWTRDVTERTGFQQLGKLLPCLPIQPCPQCKAAVSCVKSTYPLQCQAHLECRRFFPIEAFPLRRTLRNHQQRG